ncbi:chitinase [Enterobacteriaceae bacterium 89]|nr:chitinase [Enterobacteriaceae bacterium 89]
MKPVQKMMASVVAAGLAISGLPAAHSAQYLKSSEAWPMTTSELAQKEKELTSFPLMQSVKDSIQTLDNAQVEQIEPGRTTNPANVKRVESIISASDWAYLFPMRAPEYTYSNFLKAMGKFPAVCGSYTDGRDSDAICRKSLATMFAHFAQETGGHDNTISIPTWRQALVYLREVGWVEGQKNGYNGECNPDTWQGQTWPCGTDKDGDFLSYFGRGAKQLSYNYNYGPFSEAMYGDVKPLLDNPALVADTWMNLASAIFFYVYPQPPKPSMLHVIDGTWIPNDHDKANGLYQGFGVTTQIINGGVECGGSAENAQSENRIGYYKAFADYLKVPVPADEVLGCKNMKQFDDQGAGALPIYWEQDWGWSANTPNNESYACKLVNYQTPFSALKEGDYSKCVQHFFNVKLVDDRDEGTTPEPDPTPVPAENVAPVAHISGPVGAVNGDSSVSLSAAASMDANGDALNYQWTAPNGESVSGSDKQVVTFTAPASDKEAQYVITLKVSDGKLSDSTTYTLHVKAKTEEKDGDATGYPVWTHSQQWQAGDIVNNHGALYQCKPFPYNGWCNGDASFYEPGTGISWQDAWTAL